MEITRGSPNTAVSDPLIRFKSIKVPEGKIFRVYK